MSISKKGFTHIQDLLKGFETDKDKYVSREFQKYGYELAKELGDLKNKSLYIKLAKETPRALLENARYYVKDAYEVKKPAALFLWKLKMLREEMRKRGNEEIKKDK
jgi:hypothetical protein